MPENYELLETGQIEIMHQQVHDRLGADVDCDMLRSQHDSLAAELVKRGLSHDTEIICPESALAQKAPNYRRGFTDDVCTQCAFGQLFPLCNLYKENYTKGYTCDSFQYFEILELEPPHGFLMAQEKQTAIASDRQLDIEKSKIIVSNGEVFGIAKLGQPAQVKIKDFDNQEWQSQHRITQRERRQLWPDTETFYVYRVENWQPYEGVKLYEDGKVINEPKLTSKQWHVISKAKELPKQITLLDNAVSVTDKQEFVIDLSAKCKELDSVLSATYQVDIKEAETADEIIPIYSLALVRNPRMRVSKKNIEIEKKQEEGETMPFRIRKRGEEYCVVKVNPDDSDGDTSGCHDTREEAEAQLTALNINVTAEEGEAAIHADKPKKRKPKKSLEDKIFEKPKKATFMDNLRSLSKSIGDFLKSAENEEKEALLFVSDAGIAQKTVNGELWHFTWSTNAFRDREGEIFSTKSLEDYVSNNESNEDKGYFNLYHINEDNGGFNSDFARKEWQGVVGRFLVEAGPYLDNEKGQAAKKFFREFASGHPEIAPEGWGCSPEYKYLPEERVTTIYDTIWITRTSTLPRMAAANIWTDMQQLARSKNMALTEKQMQSAIEIFGQDFVSDLMGEAKKRTDDLEAAGVDHKSNEEPEPKEISISSQDFQTLAQEVAKQFQVDNSTMLEALTAMANSIKEMSERIEELEEKGRAKQLAETPRFTFNLQRASESKETTVAEGDKLKEEKPKETQRATTQAEITPAEFFGTS